MLRGALRRAKEVLVDALRPETIAPLTEYHGGAPPGRFLQGKHGITHFQLEEPPPTTKSPRLAVLIHGLGADSRVWEGPISQSLLDAGFRVLRYDFFGQGWSAGNYPLMPQDPLVFVDQLRELLDHCIEPQQPVDVCVGHSTGGNVAIHAAARRAWSFRQLALISPALWLPAPPWKDYWYPAWFQKTYWKGILKTKDEDLREALRAFYTGHCDRAWGKKDGVYLYPEKHLAKREEIQLMFKLNPHIPGALMSTFNFTFRWDVQKKYQKDFDALVSKEADEWAPRVGFIWGRYDIVCAFEATSELQAMRPEMIRLHEMPHVGHEEPLEDPEGTAELVMKCALAPPRA